MHTPDDLQITPRVSTLVRAFLGGGLVILCLASMLQWLNQSWRQARLDGDFYEAVMRLDDSEAQTLRRLGANPNARMKWGRTLLTSTCMFRDVERVKLLVSQGADPNHADGNGITPLGAALMSGKPRMVEVILRSGADPLKADDEGSSPFKYVDLKSTPEFYRGAIRRLLERAIAQKQIPNPPDAP